MAALTRVGWGIAAPRVVGFRQLLLLVPNTKTVCGSAQSRHQPLNVVVAISVYAGSARQVPSAGWLAAVSRPTPGHLSRFLLGLNRFRFVYL